MYVNPDGSIGSTSGQVADKKAALPPPKPPETEKPAEEGGAVGQKDPTAAVEPEEKQEPTENTNTQAGSSN